MQVFEKYFSGFTEKQQKQLAEIKNVYEYWNSRVNVISRKDMDEFYIHHVLHSLAIAAQFDLTDIKDVLDLGTGGGFPGVPLAIFFPGVQFLLVDSINKKLKVVQEACAALNIKNIQTLHSRVEQLPSKSTDLVVSRAVAPLKELWQWSKPLLRKNSSPDKPNGLICLKGGDLTHEIADSGCKPYVWEISKMFSEPYFEQKFILYQPLKK